MVTLVAWGYTLTPDVRQDISRGVYTRLPMGVYVAGARGRSLVTHSPIKYDAWLGHVGEGESLTRDVLSRKCTTPS